MKVWWTFPIKNSDFSEHFVTRGSIYDTFLTWHLGQRTLLRFIFSKHVGLKNRCKHDQQIFFPKMSKIHFPGLRTLRLAIWTRYFRVFPIFLGKFSKYLGTDSWAKFPENLPIFPLKAAIFVRKYMSGLVDLIGCTHASSVLTRIDDR